MNIKKVFSPLCCLILPWTCTTSYFSYFISMVQSAFEIYIQPAQIDIFGHIYMILYTVVCIAKLWNHRKLFAIIIPSKFFKKIFHTYVTEIYYVYIYFILICLYLGGSISSRFGPPAPEGNSNSSLPHRSVVGKSGQRLWCMLKMVHIQTQWIGLLVKYS